jgi:hypothetical protein
MVETQRYRVVVTFEVENEIIVINAIDLTPGGKILPMQRKR